MIDCPPCVRLLVKRARQQQFASLKADIDRGMTDLAEGRMTDFDVDRITERGKARQ